MTMEHGSGIFKWDKTNRLERKGAGFEIPKEWWKDRVKLETLDHEEKTLARLPWSYRFQSDKHAKTTYKCEKLTS